jgi:plastocyanin
VRKTRVALALLVGGMATGFLVAPAKTKPVMADDDKRIVIRDDCDPDDPTWPGPCTLEGGDVDVAEFDAELTSVPAGGQLIGHQAWRNDPPYLKIETDDDVRVRNRGGRVHTFTKVAAFGGGRVPPLNQGQQTVPECTTATNLPPGARVTLSGLGPGNHKFQCCIHPWMRAIVKVKEEEDDDEEDP